MSKASDAANSLVNAAEQVCGLYGVHVTREQSRAFKVEGAAGRWRPMFFGMWTDNFGKIHRAGKADLLARPRVKLMYMASSQQLTESFMSRPLWIECKTGKGRLEPEQIEFKNWVESNGDFYLLLHDDVRPLIEWYEAHGVEKYSVDGALPQINSIDAGLLHQLPCKHKHCGRPRKEHIGAAFGCPGTRGSVWSPDLSKAKP